MLPLNRTVKIHRIPILISTEGDGRIGQRMLLQLRRFQLGKTIIEIRIIRDRINRMIRIIEISETAATKDHIQIIDKMNDVQIDETQMPQTQILSNRNKIRALHQNRKAVPIRL